MHLSRIRRYGGFDGRVLALVGALWLLLATPCAPAAAAADEPPLQLTNSLGMRLVRIPAGEFLMGSAPDDPGAREDEQPLHRVRITRPFYLGTHEVTQAEFVAVLQTNPSSFTRQILLRGAPPELDESRFPVDGVSWFQAVEFCRQLSERREEQQAGRVYRLPTEAEWEYACRAGTTTAFHYGNDLSASEANFNGENPFGAAAPGAFLQRTTIVGAYAPNAFGLYDMHGNLNEWCLDWFDRDYYRVSPVDDPRGPERGSRRVIRGGDWYSDARDCRSAFRYADVPSGRFYALGMRIVCELTSEGARLDPLIAAGGRQTAEPPVSAAGRPLPEPPNPSLSEEWPRWRGARGDGTWQAVRVSQTWPTEGLPQVWRHELGGGYGGIAVSGGRVCVMDRRIEPEEVERALCFDAVTGELLWSQSWPVDYANVAYGNGPRATPTIVQDRVYFFGALGHLCCLRLADGKVLWSKQLAAEFGARVPLWGLSASPLIHGALVIVVAGAAPDGCLVAFDQHTGTERWRAFAEAAGYATPILIEHEGRTQLVAWTPTHVRGLDPDDGRALWARPFEVTYGNAIADPVFHEGLVLVSSYYEGSLALRVPTDLGEPETAWHDRRNLRGLMSQPLYREGFGYLLDKRHGLTCFEYATGNKVWDDDNRLTPKGRNPQATLVWLNDGDRAIALNSDGELVLIRLNPDGYVEDARAKIIGETWAHPAYAGNCVYARSDTEIVCVLLPRP